MRIAIVYDCLYPNTVGGAERWLRSLAEDLGRDHSVTYLTRRQWKRGEDPSFPGVRCVAVSPGGELYSGGGRRRLWPILLYGGGVFIHFLRHRRDYDVVHCLSYPFSSLIAIRLALAGQRETRVYCEWLEYLSSDYWRAYAGPLGGVAGRVVQKLCLRLSPAAFAFSGLVEGRLREAGFRGDLHRLTGLWVGPPEDARSPLERPSEPLILFAGRHTPDKRVTVLPDALRLARRSHPGIRAVILGDGPERRRVLDRVHQLGLQGAVTVPGFVPRAQLERLFRQATCVVSPSVRDGYGMVVAEAAAFGAPVVVCRSPDNAATELVDSGVNGAVAASPSPDAIADAILRVIAAGRELRRSTREWFAANAGRLAVEASIGEVRRVYEQASPSRPRPVGASRATPAPRRPS